MGAFSPEELERAAERVREMQKRAVYKNVPHRMPPVPNFVTVKKSGDGEQKAQSEEIEMNPKNLSKKSIFDALSFKNINLKEDGVLLAVLLLLMTSGDGDEILILALLYLLM